MKSPRLSGRLVWVAAIIFLAGCAGGPRELADRHRPSAEVPINYASYKDLSFSEYLVSIRASLKKYNGLHRSADELLQISPFEISSNGYRDCEPDKRTGVLLIHGLTDTPFLMRDIGQSLVAKNDCLLVRAIVLSGHATVPGDLLNVKYADWINATQYGVSSFSDAGVRNVFIAGFSTGGTLALNYALNNAVSDSANNAVSQVNLKGVLLFSPAIRIKQKGGFLANWHFFVSWASPVRTWFDLADDLDFAKYESFPKNAADQIYLLTTKKIDIKKTSAFPVPLFVAISQEDDTIDSDATRQFFNNRADDKSRMIVYQVGASNRTCEFTAANKVCEKSGVFKERNIVSLSHTAIPVSPQNAHYGERGDYKNCTHYLAEKYHAQYDDCMSDDRSKFVLGEKSVPSRVPVRRITFNPDFLYMSDVMNAFVNSNRD